MLHRGTAQKVTVHLNEDTSSAQGFIYEQVFQLLFDRGIAGATLIRPQEGFGAQHHLHTQEGHGATRRHLPVRIEFIETADAVEAILPALRELVQDGLIEAHETNILQAAKQEASY